jgi:hypothetical protein
MRCREKKSNACLIATELNQTWPQQGHTETHIGRNFFKTNPPNNENAKERRKVQGFIAEYLVLGGILQPRTLKPSRSRIPHSSAADVPGLWFGEDAQAFRA